MVPCERVNSHLIMTGSYLAEFVFLQCEPPPNVYTSTNTMILTPHALTVPEILSIIFSFADLSVNAANARVCKLWYDLALDALWEEVDDLRRLLRLLGPQKSDMYGPYVRGWFYFFSSLGS